MRTDVRKVGVIFLIVGLSIASAGGYCFWTTQDFLRNGLRSTGTVVGMRRPPASRYSLPVVQFETEDHNVITAVCKTGTNPPRHKVDDTVTVIYRAAAPEDIFLDDPVELWLLPSIFGGIGSIFVLVGGGMLIFSIRKPS